MSWSFLAPLYLIGGLALAIPIWVHLRKHRPVQPYAFPTLRFLIGSRIISHRTRNILRWIVLALRLIAFSALVLAFAEPWKHLALTSTGEVSILVLDVSASMKAGETWQIAKTKAIEWLDSENKHARTAIVLMGKSIRVLTSFEQPFETQEAALKQLIPTSESTNPEAALRFADRLIENQPAKQKKITVISDMAASAWQKVEWEHPLSPGVRIEPQGILPEPPKNVAITDIAVPRSFWQTNILFTVTATLKNFSSVSCESQATLRINDHQVKTESIHLEANEANELSFSVSPTELRTIKGSIQLQPNDLFDPDNERFFTVSAGLPTRIGRLTAKKEATDIYLRTALFPQADTSTGRYQWVSMDPQTSASIKESADVLFLDQGMQLSPARAETIKTFVNEGGSIILFLGDSDRLTDFEKTFLPIELGPKREMGALSAAQHFAQIQSTHPILRPFFLPRGGDLFQVAVQKWRSFRAVTAQHLIQLAANEDPILSLLPVGKGQVMIVAFPFSFEPGQPLWSDWPLQATFLPMIHQTLNWFEQKTSSTQDLIVGDPAPDGTATAQPGFCGSDQKAGSIRAVNIDSSESDLARWPLMNSFQRLENSDKKVPDISTTFMAQPDRGTNFTWWLLLAVTIFSFSELALANRVPR